jgi:hypothetical protein
VPAGEFCFDTVSYIPELNTTRLSSDFLLTLLNSKLLDWYFRLGSTNSKVNEYQFNNLPCPIFREAATPEDQILIGRAREAMKNDPLDAVRQVAPAIATAPFGPAALNLLEAFARRIGDLEGQRGRISRAARATLCAEAQAYQRASNLLLFRLVGLSDSEIAGVEERLEQML